MTDYKHILLEYVCPAIGTILANLVFSAPYRDMQKAVRTGHLGDLNPTPWAFMMGNTFAWMFYGILKRDFWLYIADVPGFLLSIWLNLGAAKLLYQQHHANEMRTSVTDYLNKSSRSLFAESKNTSFNKSFRSLGSLMEKDNNENDENENGSKNIGSPTTTITPNFSSRQENGKGQGEKFDVHEAAALMSSTVQDWGKVVWDVTSQSTPAPVQHETLVLIIASVWLAATTFVALADGVSTYHKEMVIGIMMNTNVVFFYGAPLSTIWTVIKTKSSATIHINTMIMNTSSSFFWAVYGLALNDLLVYLPMGLSFILGVIQVVLCLIFPRIPSSPSIRRTSKTKPNGSLEDTAKSTVSPSNHSKPFLTFNDSRTSLDLEDAIGSSNLEGSKTYVGLEGSSNRCFESPRVRKQILSFRDSKNVSFNLNDSSSSNLHLEEGQEELCVDNNEDKISQHETSDTDEELAPSLDSVISEDGDYLQHQIDEMILFSYDNDDDEEEDDLEVAC